MEPVHQWCFDCLCESRVVGSDFGGDWPEVVDCERFRSSLRRYIRDRNIRSRVLSDIEIGRQLKRCLPLLHHCRAAWSAFIGHQEAWPE